MYYLEQSESGHVVTHHWYLNHKTLLPELWELAKRRADNRYTYAAHILNIPHVPDFFHAYEGHGFARLINGLDLEAVWTLDPYTTACAFINNLEATYPDKAVRRVMSNHWIDRIVYPSKYLMRKYEDTYKDERSVLFDGTLLHGVVRDQHVLVVADGGLSPEDLADTVKVLKRAKASQYTLFMTHGFYDGKVQPYLDLGFSNLYNWCGRVAVNERLF